MRVFKVRADAAGQMAERVDKFGRCVVFQGPLQQAMTHVTQMKQISKLVVEVVGA